MQIYLVRHGEAKVETEDPARPLSARGRDGIERVARLTASFGLSVAEIRHSGLLRARQTAEILAAHLASARGPREADGLRPDDDPERIRIECETTRQPLMLVGHLPHLGRLASLLLVGDAGREIVRFEPGTMACLTRADGGFMVQWVIGPELAGVRRST
jgi:phosphohistidine phosphatase